MQAPDDRRGGPPSARPSPAAPPRHAAPLAGAAPPSRRPHDSAATRGEGAVQSRNRAALADELVACAQALADVVAGAHLDQSLQARTAGLVPDSARAVQDMAYGAVRRLGRLQAISGLINRKAAAPQVAALQWAALAELYGARRSAPVVIDQAVRAARTVAAATGAPPDALAGFMNGTLRRWLRERAALDARVDDEPQVRWNHPAWWVDRLQRQYPGQWQDILQASQRRAPLCLRLNPRTARRLCERDPAATGIDPGEFALDGLRRAGIAFERQGPDAVVLDQAVPVSAIPGFAQGLFTVQDPGAQLAAHLLAPQDGERILDACAAPGGKTTHLLQLARCTVLALDHHEHRLGRLRSNLEREGLEGATVRCADATDPAGWWDGRPFDRILVDAPCTASGIVRRHPDIPWHRQRGDLATFAATQRQLVGALWPLLSPGGTLLYATCSIFPEENQAVVAAMQAATGARVRPVQLPPSWTLGRGCVSDQNALFACASAADEAALQVAGRAGAPVAAHGATNPTRARAAADPQIPPVPGTLQLLPCLNGQAEHDGYFYALLSKPR